MNIKRYTVDLKAQMAVCDANFIRLLKLLPGFTESRSRNIEIPSGDVLERVVFRAEVIESFRYTGTIRLNQFSPDIEHGYYRSPEMLVRVYHDAKTAEVVSYQNHRYFKSSYAVPNKQMYHPDEKQQLNLFLAEWLTLCLDKGVSDEAWALPASLKTAEA